MNKKTNSLISTLLLSFLMVLVYAQINVGLKEGDWVEYTATYTGNPPDTYPETARIEVQTIQGTVITVEIERDLLNGTQTSKTETFDLENGAPDLLIIPSNLGEDDEVIHEDIGKVTIESVEDYNFKGTTRKLVYAYVLNTEFSWDRSTGILVEAIQTTDTFTQTLLAVNTNIVQTQASGLDPLLIYGIVIAVIIIIIVVVLLVLKRK
ncbi:hypothetical protein AC478_02655 [miscellaneous Crenarchaeota group-1 archaeon SG8-32-3]|uniref:Uncharacterized protein n=1 Tax=miscellaneous Crenarchaeota group-1 archaeon SG8-32-3 TaxID=1685125 RepID=A0A0M0BSL6_9ARCH|nr:MAG: hypothetical protein AC478_02655 [miscellaneous Crenarchaeota group-1 archaeon SG8-32-3]